MTETTAAVRDWRALFRAAWARSDLLFECLAPEALLARPIALRHPFVFYLGHLPAFAWNQVARGALGRPALRADFDRLFERGIDPADEAAAANSARGAWPERAEIVAYRDAVRAALLDLVDEVEAKADDVLTARGRVLALVLEHEAMHHETLLYMLQELDHGSKRAPPGSRAAVGPRGGHPHEVVVPAGPARLGADFGEAEFGWDNEFPGCERHVPAFRVDAQPVTNGEFAAFVEAGGYARDDLWTEEGAAWRRAAGLSRPHAWRGEGAGIAVASAFEDVPFEGARDWPAQVSWAEAAAYARWRGRRLPTEVEVHRAAYGAAGDDARLHPWGNAPFDATRANAGFVRWSPEPVGRRPRGTSAFGVEETVGNGWEWTGTPFAPFPGFRAWARTYPGYSADFFDGRHYVMLGASWATEAGLLRRSFRNWFQPHYPHVFSKFRTVAPR